jgi:PKD repeat protein
MKKFFVPILVFAMIIGFIYTTGCKKAAAPTTCFGTVPDTAYVGQQLTFTSCTQGASSYYWVFGDGGYATTARATHTYTAPGTYHGGLTTSNGTGDTKSFTIVVLRPVNTWTFQGVTDTSAYALTVGGDTIETSNFSATNINNVSNIVLVFSALPTASGSYQVINDQFATPNASQVAVFLTTPSGRNYGSTGNDHVNANITLIGGKINISIPAVEMVNVAVPSDSSSLSATITQTE